MTPLEVVELVATVKALCPGQKWDQMTPDAWALVLDDVSRADAFTAARTIYRNPHNPEEYGPRRIEADEILAEVRRMRRGRLERLDPAALVPPAGLTVANEMLWMRRARAAVANGEPVPANTRGELIPRNMAALLAKPTGPC